ncbi:MAG: pyruvate, phosphate dikinase [Deltaproteobacteria bacterium]|nr:pyruvate, phosphate dikinase [Deltaproteobacteria bacterium]
MTLTTGLLGLDTVMSGVLPGDNIVFHVDKAQQYTLFAQPFVERAVLDGHHVVYFHFEGTAPLISDTPGVETVSLNPEIGFERFVFTIHQKIDACDDCARYLFDSMSSLAACWFSDLMVGNFFALTCPFLFEKKAVALFSFLRGEHSFYATTPIIENTQVLIDVFSRQQRLFVLPRKVANRHSATMYMLHEKKDDEFIPVTLSATVAEIMRTVSWSWQDVASYRMGFWSRTFSKVEAAVADYGEGRISREAVDSYKPLLMKMMISRNSRVINLAREYLSVEDLLSIRSRMLAPGRLGGKAVGMLLARAILRKRFGRYHQSIEPHDSFFIGTDLYCTYLVSDGSWWMQQKRQSEEGMLYGSEEVRRRIMTGEFPPHIVKRFRNMLHYYGQSPIIVRSSSLLEDNFGNAFAGKYESVFLPNQGTPEQRLEAFEKAVKTIFASTLSKEALLYRKSRGILDMDEEMGLLVQRVSGCVLGGYFYPHLAGVGLSFNPYVWHESIDPNSGMLRLVFGLGTRAVDRSDDDYTRLVALNAPLRKAELDTGDPGKYAQRKVDVLDLLKDFCGTQDFEKVVKNSVGLQIAWFAERDRQVEEFARQRGRTDLFSWILNFDRILEDTDLVTDMREILSILGDSYDYPVEVEFTVNFTSKDDYRINLVQCRPMQVSVSGEAGIAPELDSATTVLQCSGPVIGRSRHIALNRLIYVVPEKYSQLSEARRHQVAEVIGRLVHLPEAQSDNFHQALIGPGRWGTTTPALGVPVAFAQINRVAVLCEIVAMSSSLVPDVSLGTHFFNELVEADILYMAMFPGRSGMIWNQPFLDTAQSRLNELLPEFAEFANVIKVVDSASPPQIAQLKLYASAQEQKAVLYL